MASEDLKSVWSRPSLIIFSTVKPTQDGTKRNFNSGTVLYLTDDNRSPLQINSERIETKKRMIDGTMRSVYVADKNTFSTAWNDIPSRSKDSTRSYISEYERLSGKDITKAITSVSSSAGKVTYTATGHTIAVGDHVKISGVSGGTPSNGYNGTFIVTDIATNTFKVENATTGTPSSYAAAIVTYNNYNTTQFGSGIDIKNWYDANTDDFWVLLVYDTSISNSVNTNAELYNVFFESFNYTVSKRGAYNDLWNVDISLVEV